MVEAYGVEVAIEVVSEEAVLVEILVVEDLVVVDTVVEGMLDEVMDLEALTPWRATVVGFVAGWPETVLAPGCSHRRWVVARPALPK